VDFELVDYIVLEGSRRCRRARGARPRVSRVAPAPARRGPRRVSLPSVGGGKRERLMAPLSAPQSMP